MPSQRCFRAICTALSYQRPKKVHEVVRLARSVPNRLRRPPEKAMFQMMGVFAELEALVQRIHSSRSVMNLRRFIIRSPRRNGEARLGMVADVPTIGGGSRGLIVQMREAVGRKRHHDPTWPPLGFRQACYFCAPALVFFLQTTASGKGHRRPRTSALRALPTVSVSPITTASGGATNSGETRGCTLVPSGDR